MVDEITHVDQVLLVEEGVGGGRDDEVVTGLGRDLGRALGEELRGLDRVDAHGHPRLLREGLACRRRSPEAGADVAHVQPISSRRR